LIKNKNYKRYLKLLLEPEKVLPKVPLVPTTISIKTGVSEIGFPKRDSPILVTANYPYTHAVVGGVLLAANLDCYLLSIDTEGYSVDMAVYLEIFKGERVKKALEESRIGEKVNHSTLIIPGLAKGYNNEIKEETRWDVLVGPICAAEIPIYLLFEWFNAQRPF
jgi:acetyl-CoA decarbonylase/synthase complex subunit gamma